MDEVDNRLLAALRKDARASVSELATVLGLSRTTVRSRIDRMRARGEIVGFTVVTKGDAAQAPVRGIMMVEIAGRGTEKIIRQMQGMSEVSAVHTTNGRWDVIVEIAVDTLEVFDAVLHRIRQLDGVTASETSLLLSTRKHA
ncbi:Lrp/AsnC family transcriptional regulator [Aliishimia ponticola]|uniref:Lrp/AsnC family transcriptional regulator n=1 Tax=Aliishimia ponticola TaxID=2499833 RepID=A0A4S4NIN2_9RHOB|nr:Lrp/AsnC family transcriptional regulator [Aliishimia ponticola]THH38755.1 Lrp/AsnC family transcriptional regulator [Aliishimia ponticola]